ncbi:MAG: hypothetical protein AB7S78_03230 [Candidatus Omnitrophota bacterium]
MKKVFYCIWFVIFFFCLFVVVCGKFKDIGRQFIHLNETDEFTYGDLYKMCLVDLYRERIDKRPIGKQSSNLDDFDVIAFGDSFFRSNLGSESFAQELAKKSGLKVYYLDSDEYFQNDTNPLLFLKSKNYKKGSRKILIYQSVERYSLDGAKKLVSDQISADYSGRWTEKVFDNDDLDYFFKDNRVIYPVVKWVANVKFHLLGEIDARIANYSVKPKMLFYKPGVEFNYRKKEPADFVMLAENLAYLRKTLHEEYNIELIYVVIPNKFTIYSEYADKEYRYDNYLSEVAGIMSREHVPFINVYSMYKDYRQRDDSQRLYYMNDSHYTPFGKAMIVEAVYQLIRELQQIKKG